MVTEEVPCVPAQRERPSQTTVTKGSNDHRAEKGLQKGEGEEAVMAAVMDG